MSTQTEEQKQQAAQEWFDTKAPQFLKDANGDLKKEYAAALSDFVDLHFGGAVNEQSLSSAANYIATKLQPSEVQAETPRNPKADRDRAIAKRWLETNAPAHLRQANGTIGPVFAKIVADYVRDNYRDIWSLENLDKAIKYLTLRGELPAAPKTSVNNSERVRDEKLRAAGVEPTQLQNHAEKKDNDTQQGLSFKQFLDKLMTGAKRAAELEPSRAVDEKIRRIPDGASPQELKKYTPLELRAYLKRQAAQH